MEQVSFISSNTKNLFRVEFFFLFEGGGLAVKLKVRFVAAHYTTKIAPKSCSPVYLLSDSKHFQQ